MEWILWGVPTNAEIALDMLTRQQDEGRQGLDEVNPTVVDTFESHSQSEEVEHDAPSSPSGLSPASRIKYEYQKRTRGRSLSGASAMINSSLGGETTQDKSGECSWRCLRLRISC